ncbi:MAG: hypothetical protein DMF63_01270 [Acidobacteria bacterium]|nr:MAG: hypothetical protein DMF63_01270 [Acidobacteriota bacterium]
MKLPTLPLSLLLVFVCLFSASAQKRKSRVAQTGVVIDESLSVLRMQPSLYALPIQRMRHGRRVQILDAAEADGVKFYKVAAPKLGWVQSDAIVGKFDEVRFVRFVQAADGFDRIQLASDFLQIYPASRFRAPMLLLFGDLIEDAAAKLSRDATSRLSRRKIAASGAPVHSYYLNFAMLDRYRKLGVTFLFNGSTRTFHYNGWSWGEIVRKHPGSAEAVEAKKRIESLKIKMAG